MMWAISPAGKSMPLDARPYAVLVRDNVVKAEDARITRYRTEHRGEELHAVKDAEGAYVSHWQTCATRDQHRKPR